MANSGTTNSLAGKYAGQYAVIKTLSFDSEMDCSIFDTYEEAEKYLQQYWEDYYNTEIAEGLDGVAGLDEYMCYHEEDYARVTWLDGCYAEFRLCAVTHPRKLI